MASFESVDNEWTTNDFPHLNSSYPHPVQSPHVVVVYGIFIHDNDSRNAARQHRSRKLRSTQLLHFMYVAVYGGVLSRPQRSRRSALHRVTWGIIPCNHCTVWPLTTLAKSTRLYLQRREPTRGKSTLRMLLAFLLHLTNPLITTIAW